MWAFVDIGSRGGSKTSLEDTRGFVLPTVLMLMMVLSMRCPQLRYHFLC